MDSFKLTNYKLLKLIGSGNFSEVFKIQDKTTGKIYAAKISTMTFDESKDDFRKNFEREVSIISKVHHPSILKFIGLSLTNFQKESKPVIVTDYLPNGSLEDILKLSQRGCSPEQWNDTMKLINIYGIASALSFLHENEIIHRDLKPANILMDKNYYPILADFGLSKKKDDNNNINSTNDIKGTPIYIAPEIWTNSRYSKEADVYAFAYIIYELFTNEKPFEKMTMFKLSQKICLGERPDASTIPEPYKSLIEDCWQTDPSKRLTSDQIVSKLENDHDFILDTIEEEDFISYVSYIQNTPKSIDDSVSKSFENLNKKKMILSKSEYNKLSSSAQKIVTKAIDDPKKQFEVGQNLINGQNGFPKNVQTGIQYLKEAIEGENIDAIILYNRMLIIGNKIECDIEKAKENLKKFEDLNNPDIIFLQAKIERKEENNEKSIELLKKAIELENAEAMFAYGQMLFLGEGCNEDEKEAMKYFNMAKENGFDKGDEFFEKLKEKKKSKNKMTKPKPKPKNKSKSSNKKSVDIVFLIDGTITNKYFYETVKSSFEKFANNCVNEYQSFEFKFGAVIYVDFIVSKKIPNSKPKRPLIMDLTDDIEKVQSFFEEHYTAGGGIRFANDWAVGYSCLVEKINWSESSEKVVIQMCHTPGHGRSYTMRGEWIKNYFNVPRFMRDKTFDENFRIFKEMQDKQRNWLIANIAKIAEKGIKMYCLNGNEVAMYCFKRVSGAFFKKGGKKFVIKNLFGFTSLEKNDPNINTKSLKKQIEDFLSNVVKSCTSETNEENEFEKSCYQEFKKELDQFFVKNNANYNSAETTDNDSDVDEYDSNNDDDDDDDINIAKPVKMSGRSKSSQKNSNAFDFFDHSDFEEKKEKPKRKRIGGFKSTSNIEKIKDDDDNDDDENNGNDDGGEKKGRTNRRRRFYKKKQ